MGDKRTLVPPGHRLGVAMGLATLAALGVWLFYAYVFVVQTPYAGIWLHGSWRVEAVEVEGTGANLIRPGDQILAIGDLTYEGILADRRRVPFAGFHPGDRVPIRLVRDGQEQVVEWPLPGPTLRAVAKRLSFFIPVLLLWLLGSLAWFVLRPRNEAWAVVILFHHVTAIWLALGPMSVYCTAWSSLVLHGVTWLMAPVYLHLHLVLPSPFLSRRVRHRFLAVLYGAAVILAVLELFQALPFTAYFFGFLTAILGSLVLLILRWWVRRTPVERQATRLMTTGLLLSFGPLLALAVGVLLAPQAYIQLTTMIFLVLLVPVLPMFYAYAAFKRYLGAMEVRANRLLGLYSFGLLYVTVYLLVLLPSRWWFDTPPGMLLYSLGTSTVFVLAAPALQARFQRFFNRIAYGARHDPTELLILFAQRIPAVQDYRALVDMLADEILPTLLIRQSALYVWGGGEYSLVYSRGISLEEKTTLPERIPELLTEAGRYRAPFPGTPAEKDWVRLVIPLQVQDRWVGVWLFGGRDPDDFYPQADVDLLTALASQVAISLENTRLYADLRQRAQQLQELYERTRFTQFAVDHASDAALWVDDRGRITYANHAACRLLGRPPEAVVGVRVRDLRLEVPEVSWEAFCNELKTQGVATVEVRYRTPEGRRIPLELTVNRVSFGTRSYDCVFARDITERKEAESAIQKLLAETQEQAAWLREILDTVSEGIVLLDDQRRVVRANPLGTNYLQTLAGAYIGAELTRLGDRYLDEFLRPSHAGVLQEIEVAGPPRQVFEIDARPIRRLQGGWVIVLRDVTERREIQERVQTQERLAAIGQLAAGIAHDFNNLLTGIMGFAELLRDRPDLPDSAREWANTILEQGRSATQLIRQILDFSRKSPMEKRPVELVAFLSEATQLFRRTLTPSIEVHFEYEAGEYWVQGDPTQLQQILMNLVVNARDAMPKGGRLTIRLGRFRLDEGTSPPYPGLGPGEWVRLEVADTGTGIPAEILPRIFEPFFTTKERGRGTGLGLAQAYGLVRQHDGFIDVRSQVGVGTTFIIYLPALRPAAVAPPAAAVSETLPTGGGELILLVEDEDAVRDVLRTMLERLGYRVIVAASGPEAIRLYQRHMGQIALVLSDMVMPDMNGLALFQALRTLDPRARVALVTGHPLGEEIREFLHRGLVGWIQKPVSLADLARLLQQALRKAPTPTVIDFQTRKAP